MSNSKVILPGSTLGMLGDGQLGQMTAIAAANLGYKVAVLGPGGRHSPTGHVAYWAEAWSPRDTIVSEEQLDRFCSVVGHNSTVMIEWENIPVSLVKRIEAKGIPVRPGGRVLAVAQDRLLEKQCAEQLGIPVPRYSNIENEEDIARSHPVSIEKCILKTRRNGYDGKGQVSVPNPSPSSIKEAWDVLGNVPCVLETLVGFACEISMIAARSPSFPGVAIYGPFQNSHENGILRTTKFPFNFPVWRMPPFEPEILRQAWDATKALVEHLDVHGLLAVEFFVLQDGTVIFNEIAPRPHNSGHLTIECHDTSQFEQYVRAACCLPMGSNAHHSSGEMTNILGDEATDPMKYFLQGAKATHLYGKGQAKPGRKMGHITRREVDMHDGDED
jgi:5-(carboxyamino)imidazole ribonucleotide synthase